jgi:hypothetical protein
MRRIIGGPSTNARQPPILAARYALSAAFWAGGVSAAASMTTAPALCREPRSLPAWSDPGGHSHLFAE